MEVRVLFICLGNICRSPMAEAVFRDLVKKKICRTALHAIQQELVDGI